MYYDEIALANRKTSKRKSTKLYALRHKPTGLYFHSKVKNYSWDSDGNYYTAPYPMLRKQKGAFSFWISNMKNPEEWEVVEKEVENA